MSEDFASELTRREFLKLGAVGAGAAGLGGIPEALIEPPKEGLKTPERKFKPTMVVQDVFDIGNNIQQLTRDTLPWGYNPEQELASMGVTELTVEGLKRGEPQSEEQALVLMAHMLAAKYESHGRQVVSAGRNARHFFDSGTKLPNPRTESIAGAVRVAEAKFDDVGNPTAEMKVSKDEIINRLEVGDETVVNMSFQIGDLPFKYQFRKVESVYPDMGRQFPYTRGEGDDTKYYDYQGTEIPKVAYDEILGKINETEVVTLEPSERSVDFVDGYAGENAFSNIKNVAEIAKKFPDKIFVVAGGNPTYFDGLKFPDIRDARERLSNQGLWPPNILVVGFVGKEGNYNGPASYGADIYVRNEDLERLGFEQASSFATPVISEYIRELIGVGGIKSFIDLHTELRIAGRRHVIEMGNKEDIIYRVFDMQRAKSRLKELKEEADYKT